MDGAEPNRCRAVAGSERTRAGRPRSSPRWARLRWSRSPCATGCCTSPPGSPRGQRRLWLRIDQRW